MGFSRKRVGRGGKARYTAYYQDAHGRVLSAGTYSSKGEADSRWQDAEAKVREGRGNALMRGKQEFEKYVQEKWFPNHRLELRSRENYTYYLNKRIIPYFSGMPMIGIMPDDVRAFVAHLERDGVPPSSIRYCLTILSAIFTTALNDQVVFFHPCRGVSGPVVAKKVRQIVTPEQYDVLHEALGDDQWRLLVETDVETGLRWGELTELRPGDFDFGARRVTVSRAVVELTARFHPDGDSRFTVKQYPKDEEHRVVSFSPQLAAKLQAFIRTRKLADGDLLFTMPAVARVPRLREVPEQRPIPGTRYRHGTISAYSGYKCHCDDCRAAYAIYRAGKRRELGAAPRRVRTAEADGHLSRRWFRNSVWVPARAAAGLSSGVKVHSLRHAHASWLLAGGADIARVKERLGHSSILTTQKYLHTLPDLENDAALDAFAKIRNRSQPGPGPSAGQGRGR